MNLKYVTAAILVAICLSTNLFAQTPEGRPDAGSSKPNVIFIYADDLGYGELGSYGQRLIRTPHLDKLAAEGMRFTQFYSSSPVCGPARCSLLTGIHTGQGYIRGNHELGGFADSLEAGQMPLHANAFTIGHLMQQAGYKTACIGKWGLGMGNTTGNPNKQGFDYFYGYYDQKQSHNFYPTHLWENGHRVPLNNPPMVIHSRIDPQTATDADFEKYIGNDYSIDKMAERAAIFIERFQNQPFFLYLPLTSPHLALQAPKEAVNEYIGRFDEQPYYGQDGYCPSKYPKSTYAAMITHMDKRIGELLDLLKKLNLDNNTLVIFSSDNGPTFNSQVDVRFFGSARRLRGLKMDLYEGGIRVPLIARWPGKIQSNTTTDFPAVQYDIMPTLAELTGMEKVRNTRYSFLPILLGKTAARRPHFYWEFAEKSGQVAIRLGDWKGVKSNLKKNQKAPLELYNLATDPAETTDVAAAHPDIVARLEKLLISERRPSHLPEWDFIPQVQVKYITK